MNEIHSNDSANFQQVFPSFYAIIPANVRYCKELEPAAKLLYGEITALASSQGFCWASNQYFADLYGVEVFTVQRWIKSLKDLNFISVEIIVNGIQRQRRIWITPEIKKMFTKPQNCGDVTTKMLGGGTPSPYNSINTYSNSLPKKEEVQKGASPPKPPLPPNENNQLIERAPHIQTSQEEHEKLVKHFGEKETQEAYKFFSEWKTDTPKSKWKKNDYRSMLRWVFKALKEKRLKEEELCIRSQIVKEKKEKKNWKKEFTTFKPQTSEKNSEEQLSVRVRSPYLKQPNKPLPTGLNPEETS